MSQIYGFSFGGTRNILYKLQNIDACYIIFPNNINYYLKMLLDDRPDYILGLGVYGGRDRDKIRIETICSNKKGKGYIEEDEYKEISINPFLEPSKLMKYANYIGTSHCNFISWKIMKLISENNMNTKYAFLHIPKGFSSGLASEIIDESIKISLKPNNNLQYSMDI